jgi:cytochrome c556
MKPVTKIIAVLVIFGILIGAAWAQFSKPEKAVKYRQSVMFVIGQHFGRLGAMVKGNQPYDQKSFASNTAVIETLAGLPWEAFLVPGSDQGKTTMKSSVLKDPDGLKSLSQQFQIEVGKLSAAAKGNDFNAIKAQFGAVAQSCKSCHRKTRK